MHTVKASNPITTWDKLTDLASDDVIQCQKNRGVASVGKFIFAVKYDVQRDSHYYSKAWHRLHGPKITIFNRRVEMYVQDRTIPEGCRLVGVRNLKNFCGNYLIRSICTLEDNYKPACRRP